MTIAMRAKMKITSIGRDYPGQEKLTLSCVAAAKYGEDGSDENNSFARFSPDGRCELTIANPALLGQFHKGEEYYLDFTLAGGVAQPIDPPAPPSGESAPEPVT